MPRNRIHEVKVGIFVAAGLAILTLFVVVLTGIRLGGREDAYRVKFANVAGLENGSIVTLGGHKVGRVKSVGIAQDDPGIMEAVIRVKKGTPIRENSTAEMTAVGVTGSMFLSISLGTPDSPLLKPGSKIRGVEAASFQHVLNRVLARMESLTEGVEKVLASGDVAVDELTEVLAAEIHGLRQDLQKELAAAGVSLRGQIASVGGQARSTLEEGGQRLAAALGAVERVSKQVEEFFEANRTELRSVIVNFDSISKRIDDMILEFSGGQNGEELQSAAADLRHALQRARSLLSYLDETVASHREDIHLLITDLRDTGENLNEFTTTLREQPAAVIFKPAPRPRDFER